MLPVVAEIKSSAGVVHYVTGAGDRVEVTNPVSGQTRVLRLGSEEASRMRFKAALGRLGEFAYEADLVERAFWEG